MNTIAFLRSIEVQQTNPYLADAVRILYARGTEAVLFYTDGNCGPDDFPGEAIKLDPDVTPDGVVDAVLRRRVGGVVSISIPDENALRDAVAAEQLIRCGIPTTIHNVKAVDALSNKWKTKRLVTLYGLRTPEAILLDGDLLNARTIRSPAYKDVVRKESRRLGFPLLTKPLWDCLGNGIRFHRNAADVETFLAAPYDGNCILERCLLGDLCSVEVIGQDQRYVFQPLIWKGRTEAAPSFPFDQVRHSQSSPEALQSFERIKPQITALCDGIKMRGAIEIEMIYVSGEYFIIEINPRVSGSTSISVAASGFNTYEALAAMLLGTYEAEIERADRNRARLAIQFPYQSVHVSPSGDCGGLDVIRTNNFTVEGRSYANALIAGSFEGKQALVELVQTHFDINPSCLGQLRDIARGSAVANANHLVLQQSIPA